MFPLNGFYHYGIVASDFDKTIEELSASASVRILAPSATILLILRSMFCRARSSARNFASSWQHLGPSLL